MTFRILLLTAVLSCGSAVSAFAISEYNPVPAGDMLFARCKQYGLQKYSGGKEPSLISGQSKVDAFCTCMWNETPDNFKGNLGAYADTTAGASMNKTCETYSGWSD